MLECIDLRESGVAIFSCVRCCSCGDGGGVLIGSVVVDIMSCMC